MSPHREETEQGEMTLAKQFKKDFKDGLEFWTSQDGTLMSVAVCFSIDWPKRLKAAVEARGEQLKANRVKVRYAFKEWAEREYFFWKGDKGKVWRLQDTETLFQVYDYTFEIPK